MQHSGARKREWSASSAASNHGSGGYATAPREEGDVIEKEMKRLRLAKEDDDQHRSERRWPALCEDDGGDVDMIDMDADCSHQQLQIQPSKGQWGSPRIDYKPINSTLRECHYLRQLRKFQAERVSHLERRAPTDAAAAAVMHAMHGRRR